MKKQLLGSQNKSTTRLAEEGQSPTTKTQPSSSPSSPSSSFVQNANKSKNKRLNPRGSLNNSFKTTTTTTSSEGAESAVEAHLEPQQQQHQNQEGLPSSPLLEVPSSVEEEKARILVALDEDGRRSASTPTPQQKSSSSSLMQNGASHSNMNDNNNNSLQLVPQEQEENDDSTIRTKDYDDPIIDPNEINNNRRVISPQELVDSNSLTDIVKNRVDNSLAGIYLNETSDNNTNTKQSKGDDDEDVLDREIREMRKSAQEIEYDELEGLIDRPEIHSLKPQYFSSSLNRAKLSPLTSKTSQTEKVSSSENSEMNSHFASTSSSRFATSQSERKSDTDTAQDQYLKPNDRLSPGFNMSRASSSFSIDSSISQEETPNEHEDAEAQEKTYEDETFRRYLKIPPEERERLKNRQAELPIRFDDFIALHGYSKHEQKIKREKRDDYMYDSLAFIDSQHFTYDSEKDFLSEESSPGPLGVVQMEKKNKRKKKRVNDLKDYDDHVATMTEQQFKAHSSANKQFREMQRKMQNRRKIKQEALQKHVRATEEMVQKVERRSKIFGEWAQQQGIITSDVSNIIPKLNFESEVKENESTSTDSFFITEDNEDNTNQNNIDLLERRKKMKQRYIPADPKKFDTSIYHRPNTDRQHHTNSQGNTISVCSSLNYQDHKERTSSMPNISRCSNQSVAYLSFWGKATIPKRKKSTIRVMDSITSNRDIGHILNPGGGKPHSIKDHLPKI
ncbi:hypothetical protein FDP41_005312 [Naegleria fowleri]|uniref:Uncharacterized protein n=1 Tax=Naegleria fowleri TaxID=5763 RepID=A0A6A5BRE7_NAEFO|nr:uncharacterized protein FDP41_005312 [Naegleria fowleri]KAF0975985.1 hypothetical protein FDP41_005312 [Naegleria fowleri]CAG4710375.1 unnamed protein product [Naegleria fowleri]